MKKGLTRRGFTSFVAGNGEEAVRLASQCTPDAILMDIQMPGIDGFRQLGESGQWASSSATVPIIALTAFRGSVSRKAVQGSGYKLF